MTPWETSLSQVPFMKEPKLRDLYFTREEEKFSPSFIQAFAFQKNAPALAHLKLGKLKPADEGAVIQIVQQEHKKNISLKETMLLSICPIKEKFETCIIPKEMVEFIS